MAEDLERSATGVGSHTSQNGSSDSESDSDHSAAPWARHAGVEGARGMVERGSETPGVRSPRRGGAAHLKVHLEDDARHKLCAAGGWAPSTQTAELYAGLTLEATKHWARLMIRPVTLL